MKKLIGILSVSLLSASSSLNLVSCFDDETGKKHDNKKHLKKDEASDNEENEEKISDNILEKLQNLRLTAHLKANGSNTMANLISEISNRKEITAIVQDYDFKVTTDIKKESVLTQSSYQFTITLESDQSDAKDDNSITANFEVIVKKETANLEKENNLAILDKADEAIKKYLEKFYFVADNVNTYKDLEDELKTNLIKTASDKNVSLEMEFINSIFKNENEVIYAIDNPVQLQVKLICKDNNEYFTTKTYDSIVIGGYTKDLIEAIRMDNSKNDDEKGLLRQLFKDQKFIDRLSELSEIKADDENTTENLINKLESSINDPSGNFIKEVFNTSKSLQYYKYHFSSPSDDKKLLNADIPVEIKISAFDENAKSSLPFFEDKFMLNPKKETDEEKFNRVVKRIKAVLDSVNNEFDLTKEVKLQADGKMTWNDLLNKLSNKDDFKKWFGIANLINIDKNIDIINFSFSLDENQGFTKEQILTSSEDKYINVNLDFLPAISGVDQKNKISTKLKFKIGGINRQKMLEEISEKALSKIKAVTENYKTITERLFDKDVSYIKNEINDELQKIKDEIPELQDEKAKKLYNGKWNIDITSTNRKDDSILFHDEEIKWDINLNFYELSSNQSKLHENLNFSTFIDWNKHIMEEFSVVDKMFNDLWKRAAITDDNVDRAPMGLVMFYGMINLKLKNKLLEIKRLGYDNYNFSDVYYALENKVDKNTKNRFYSLGANSFYFYGLTSRVKYLAKIYPDLKLNVDRKGPNNFEFTIKIKEFTHKFKPAMNIINDNFSDFPQWQGFNWILDFINIVMESFKYFAENVLGKDSSY